MSKGLLSNDTIVQADYCPRRLLSKESSFPLLKINPRTAWKTVSWTKICLDKCVLGQSHNFGVQYYDLLDQLH